MVKRYDTGNPVPSGDPKDFWDNSLDIDAFVNGSEYCTETRIGRKILTLLGIDKQARDAINDFENLINDKIIAQGGVQVLNEWIRLNDAPPSAEFLMDNLGYVTPEMFGAIGDGVADDTLSFIESLSHASGHGLSLLVYSDYNISGILEGLWDIPLLGNGKIIINGNYFYITQSDQENALYVSPNGSDSSDGLSRLSALKSIGKAFEILSNRIGVSQLKSNFKIKLLAGTHSSATLDKHLSRSSNLIIEGELSSSSEKLSIIDGGNDPGIGLYIRTGNRVTVNNLMIENFSGNYGQGVASDLQSSLLLNNVEINNCGWVGVNCRDGGNLRLLSSKISGCQSGILMYGNVTFTVGHPTTPERVVINNCYQGIGIQNGSQGHVDYTDIDDCTVAVGLVNNSRVHLDSCHYRGNRIGISSEANSNFIESGDTVKIDNLIEYQCSSFSLPYNHSNNFKYDVPSSRYIFNDTLNNIPYLSTSQYVFRMGDDKSTIDITSRSSQFGIKMTGINGSGILYFNDSNQSFRFVINGTPVMSVNATSAFPESNNTVDLGNNGQRFKNIFLNNQPSVSSDARLKKSISNINEKYLEVFNLLDFKQFAMDGNSIHFGIIAQDWIGACVSLGIDPHESGVLVGSEEEGYAIRYGELQNIFNAYILEKLKML